MRFITGFSTTAALLNKLLKGTQAQSKSTFVLSPEARQFFQTLKEAFTKAPLLLHFDPQKPIRLETDAPAIAIAGILLQPETYLATPEKRLQRQDQWHPVAFWSRKLNNAEKNYNSSQSRLLAIVDAIKH